MVQNHMTGNAKQEARHKTQTSGLRDACGGLGHTDNTNAVVENVLI